MVFLLNLRFFLNTCVLCSWCVDLKLRFALLIYEFRELGVSRLNMLDNVTYVMDLHEHLFTLVKNQFQIAN
jgi:hypothetical protein